VLGALGANLTGGLVVPVEALALDTKSSGPGALHHTNQGAGGEFTISR